MTKYPDVKNITFPALFIALGLVLPLLAGQNPQIGNMFLPMHIPVLLAGIVCGWKYGLAIGFALPLLRYFLFGAPPIYPIGVAMAFELAAYGAVIGYLYNLKPFRSNSNLIYLRPLNKPIRQISIDLFKPPYNIYFSLIAAMIAGRAVWGVVNSILFNMLGWPFTWQIFVASAFFNAIPGIVLQIVFIPFITIILKKRGMLK